MSASTGAVLYDRPFSFPPASIAFCRGRAKRDPSVGVFWSKSASFRQFQWRGESLGEARSAVGFVGNSPPVRASGLDQKSASPIQRRAAVIGRPFLDRLENHSPFPSFLAYPREIRPFLDNGLQGVEKSFLAPRLVVIRQSGNVSGIVKFDPETDHFENFNKIAAQLVIVPRHPREPDVWIAGTRLGICRLRRRVAAEVPAVLEVVVPVEVADDFIAAFEILLLNLEVRSGFLDANVITHFSSFLPFA